MNDEKKIVIWSMLVLFLWITMVYSLAYMKNAPLLTDWEIQIQEESDQKEEPSIEENIINTWESTVIVDLGKEKKSIETWEEKDINKDEIGSSIQAINTWWNTNDSLVHWKGQDPSLMTDLASTWSIKFLSGTKEFFWISDIVDLLRLNPNYILQDSEGILFINLWSKTVDLVWPVQQLGGNIYTMTTEKEIRDNQLFWDKISFINMSWSKNKYVFMMIEINQETWLIQIPVDYRDLYHQKKAYLKSLFI